jgi:hypothetical protein
VHVRESEMYSDRDGCMCVSESEMYSDRDGCMCVKVKVKCTRIETRVHVRE